METEVIIDHFYVYNNVAVFPMDTAINFFPNFIQKLIRTDYNPISNNRMAVFAAVTSNTLITSNNFDVLELFGCAIFNLENKTIEYIKTDSNLTKTKLLDVITYNLKNDDVFIDMYISNPNFDVDATFLVEYGFVEPKVITDKIRLKYVIRPPIKLTLMQIKSVVASLKFNVIVLNMFISKVVANILSKCINEMYEASGNLSIIKYENGAAIIGVNSDDIINGTEGTVDLPNKYSPLVFHTHPDHITREFKAFISWPSGQDMMVVALSYLQYRDQLVHFVISPEGIWTIHVTTEFQKLLVKLRTINSYECSKSILEAILRVFTTFENPRLTKSVDAIERHTIGNTYLTTTKNYKLSNLYSDVPQLQEQCANLNILKDVQLYDVSLVKWKQFTDEGVFLSFDYISDIPGGLSPFFFPFS
jgi:hypothetical protein